MHTEFVVNSYPNPKNSTDKAKIRRVFMRFYRSGAWASRILGVARPTISQWLRGKKTSRTLDAEMPALAQRLLDTNGACIKEDAPSVRSKIHNIRKRK